jgi:hypothetical protein
MQQLMRFHSLHIALASTLHRRCLVTAFLSPTTRTPTTRIKQFTFAGHKQTYGRMTCIMIDAICISVQANHA